MSFAIQLGHINSSNTPYENKAANFITDIREKTIKTPGVTSFQDEYIWW